MKNHECEQNNSLSETSIAEADDSDSDSERTKKWPKTIQDAYNLVNDNTLKEVDIEKLQKLLKIPGLLPQGCMT